MSVDSRPWASHTPTRLTAPVTPVEVLAAELAALGLLTVDDLVSLCEGSLVRAGHALTWWDEHRGGGL